MISPDKREILRAAYLRGDSCASAAKQASVSHPTASRKFSLFRFNGLQRVERSKPPPLRPKMYGLPVYDGPDWIGVAIGADR